MTPYSLQGQKMKRRTPHLVHRLPSLEGTSGLVMWGHEKTIRVRDLLTHGRNEDVEEKDDEHWSMTRGKDEVEGNNESLEAII